MGDPASPPGNRRPRAVGRSALHASARVIRSHPRLFTLAKGCRRLVRSTPLPPLLRRWWAWIHASQMRAKDLLWILDALDAAKVPYAVGGGWGVDALVGHQTRKHQDVDLVLLDFERDEPRVRLLLGPLGFRRIHNSGASSIWMPMRSLLDDDAGRRIDLVNVDEERLVTSLQRMTGNSDSAQDRRPPTFGVGLIGGREVVCLSTVAQLLFHTGFQLRPHHRRDATLLRQTSGLRSETVSEPVPEEPESIPVLPLDSSPSLPSTLDR